MKRRKFLQHAAAGGLLPAQLPGLLLRKPRPCALAIGSELAKESRIRSSARSRICANGLGSSPKRGSRIQPFAGGEIVPALQVMDATQNGTVDCGHTLTAFYIGKNPAYAFDSGVAFGLNNRQQNAWMYYGGGLELLRELFRKNGMVQIPMRQCRRADGRLLPQEDQQRRRSQGPQIPDRRPGRHDPCKLGVVPQQIPTADIYPVVSSAERSMRRSGSAPMMTRSSGCIRLRNITITLAGGKAPP